MSATEKALTRAPRLAARAASYPDELIHAVSAELRHHIPGTDERREAIRRVLAETEEAGWSVLPPAPPVDFDTAAYLQPKRLRTLVRDVSRMVRDGLSTPRERAGALRWLEELDERLSNAVRVLPALPEPWRLVRRVDDASHRDRIRFEAHEGETWPETDPPRPRESIDVQVWHPFSAERTWEVSWPSTSDKRPALARALAYLLLDAADEAERRDREVTP